MKRIVVISGKGGTGKTVLSAALVSLAENVVAVDCDVDASNLHLLLSPEIKRQEEFRFGVTARINRDKCVQCGACCDACRFGAVSKNFDIDPVFCEGCGACALVCPRDAVEMTENVSGRWFISQTRFGPFVHARLGTGEENSGKLVSLIKQKADELARERDTDFQIIDGSPGIGCPVIASLAGVDQALIVTEPTVSGLHDADRVIKLTRHFRIPVQVVINKYDLNLQTAQTIVDFCGKQQIPVAGKIAFDPAVVESAVKRQTLIEATGEQTKSSVIRIWDRIRIGNC